MTLIIFLWVIQGCFYLYRNYLHCSFFHIDGDPALCVMLVLYLFVNGEDRGVFDLGKTEEPIASNPRL